MANTTQLVWGLLFGVIGLSFFVYGKRQRSIVPLTTGLGLMIFPYFVSNVYLLVIVGVALVFLPYFVKI